MGRITRTVRITATVSIDPNIERGASYTGILELNELKEKLKGKKVFLRYDNIRKDEDNNALCYLYLQNKTFINAHLFVTTTFRISVYTKRRK